jgi:class 3 adenylate cyclase/tetratricopeptide (TPR) repeat protein
VVRCATCGQENPDIARFCLACGAPLAARGDAGRRERKVVSALFCDLAGFTARSEREDPEDVQRRLARYHSVVRRELESFGGTVEKFIGDAVMAVFGAPVAHEDDAERAVRAGLRVAEAIEELNATQPGLALSVRIGVNTGDAVVALAASPERGESLVAGDVVNTAARIQAHAPVGAVAVGEATQRATSRVFEYAELGPIAARGKAAPVPVWRAVAARARVGVDVMRGSDSPFVGRQVERTLLQGLYERAVRDRAVQLVTLVGEPGIGKSRLVAELYRHLDARPEIVRWRQGRCLPYGDDITFWALGEIVKAHAGVLESDAPAAAAAKLDAVLPEGEDRHWLQARLLALLGVDSGAQASREESFAAWRRFLEGIAEREPAVLVFEDLHWADDALLAFLRHFAEWADDVPILLVCTARPELYERHAGWAGGVRNATSINLVPLSEPDTRRLVTALLEHAPSADVLAEAVLRRAGGNPLYAEEFVRLLLERATNGGDGGADAIFPESVQALIAARLDTLPVARKELLQDAAVVGRVFWAGALAEMGGRAAADVERELHELARKELVRRARQSSLAGEAEYAFWHGLVRDVAYEQIPRGERARRHAAAADWLERRAGERPEDVAEVLVHHYRTAIALARADGDEELAGPELRAAARRVLVRAGERALGLDTSRAVTRFAQAAELGEPGDPATAEIRLRFAEAARQAGRYGDARAALEELLPGLRARNDAPATARALLLLGLVAVRTGEESTGERMREAISLLRPLGATPRLIEAYAGLARYHALRGENREAIAAADEAIALSASLGLPEPGAALCYHGLARAELGDAGGVGELERAVAVLVDAGAGHDAAAAMNNLGIADYAVNGPASSLARFVDCIEFCRRRGLGGPLSAVECNPPGVLADLGRPDEAVALARPIAARGDQLDDLGLTVEPRAVDVLVHAARGEVEGEAAAAADHLVRHRAAVFEIDVRTIGLIAAAAFRAAQGDHPAAVELVRELLEIPDIRTKTHFVRYLPTTLRASLGGGPAFVRTVVDGLTLGEVALHRCVRATVGAVLAEAAGGAASSLHAQAAEEWRAFGHVPETAYALLGLGRALVAEQRSEDAIVPLVEARETFTALRYAPARAEAEGLLGRAGISLR